MPREACCRAKDWVSDVRGYLIAWGLPTVALVGTAFASPLVRTPAWLIASSGWAQPVSPMHAVVAERIATSLDPSSSSWPWPFPCTATGSSRWARTAGCGSGRPLLEGQRFCGSHQKDSWAGIGTAKARISRRPSIETSLVRAPSIPKSSSLTR